MGGGRKVLAPPARYVPVNEAQLSSTPARGHMKQHETLNMKPGDDDEREKESSGVWKGKSGVTRFSCLVSTHSDAQYSINQDERGIRFYLKGCSRF